MKSYKRQIEKTVLFVETGDVRRIYFNDLVIRNRNSLSRIEFQFREMFRKQLGDRAKVYEVKRFKIAGTQCIRMDALLDPGKVRSIYHWILLKGRAIQFTMNVRQENCHWRMEEFTGCLKTLKFD